MAAPSKLTPEVQRILVQAVGLGAPLTHACKAAGISYDCLNDWEHRAAAGRDPYVQLFQQLEQALGQRTMRWLAHIEKAASEGNWTASAWKLERLGGPEFQRKDRLDVTVNVEELDDRTLDAYIEAAASHKRLGPPAGRERKAS